MNDAIEYRMRAMQGEADKMRRMRTDLAMQVDGEQGTVLDRVKSHAFDVHARTDYVAPGEQRMRFGRML